MNHTTWCTAWAPCHSTTLDGQDRAWARRIRSEHVRLGPACPCGNWQREVDEAWERQGELSTLLRIARQDKAARLAAGFRPLDTLGAWYALVPRPLNDRVSAESAQAATRSRRDWMFRRMRSEGPVAR